MAVVPRQAKVRIADTATGLIYREWLATAVVQDSAAGAAVNITVDQFSGGATPPGFADTLTLSLYTDAGALIRAYTLNGASSSQTVSFSFTADGTATGAARAGTVEIAIRATRTTIATYDVESDGTPNTPGTGNTSTLDRGWIRATTTSTTVLSNVALGGAKAAPAEYDESLYARTTLGAALYVARALTVAVSGGGLSAATNSSAPGPWDVTFANVADDRFPAAVTAAATSLTVPNATLTGLAATVLTATNDTLNVDPRLTATHHFQVDDNVFGVAKNDATKSMLSTQSGFLWAIFKTARTAAGVNGLTATQTMTPAGPGSPASVSGATTTQDAQAGVSPRLDWTASKPGGTWNKTTDVTAPADIDPDTYLLGSTDALVLLAPDPRLRVVVGAGPYGTAPEDDHWHPGNPLLVGLAVVNSETLKVITPDATPVPSLIIGRFNQTFGRAEFFDVDLTWKATSGGATLYAWPLSASAGDSQIFIRVFGVTTAFNTADLFFIGKASVGGTPYSGPAAIGVAATANSHTAYALDATAFALGGLVSFR